MAVGEFGEITIGLNGVEDFLCVDEISVLLFDRDLRFFCRVVITMSFSFAYWIVVVAFFYYVFWPVTSSLNLFNLTY